MEKTNFAVLFESAAFLRHFEEMPDPRQRGKVAYPLNEILLLCLLAVIAGADSFTDIARFGRSKLALLRRFLPFENGTPAHDHLGDIFATLDAEAFQRCFAAWVAEGTGCPAEVVAIDGKTLRRSYQKKDAKDPIHMVSAFAARQRLVLGQAARLLILGLTVGVGIALLVTRALSTQLFGIGPTDPVTYGGAVAVLAFATILAGELPARRATKVDPMVALRCE